MYFHKLKFMRLSVLHKYNDPGILIQTVCIYVNMFICIVPLVPFIWFWENKWMNCELNCILSVLVLLTTRRSSQMIAAYLQLVIANCQEFHSKLQTASNLRIIRYFKRWIDGQCCLQIEGSQFWNKKEIIHSFPFLDLFVSTCIYTPYVSIYII